MKTVTPLAFSLALLAFGTSAAAAESTSQSIKHDAPAGITPAFYACIDKADSDVIASAACLTNEKTAQDNRLNATYKALMAKLNGDQKQKLIAAERAWLDLQTKTSTLEGDLYGSEQIANLQISQNEIFRLCERANALNTYLSLVNDK